MTSSAPALRQLLLPPADTQQTGGRSPYNFDVCSGYGRCFSQAGHSTPSAASAPSSAFLTQLTPPPAAVPRGRSSASAEPQSSQAPPHTRSTWQNHNITSQVSPKPKPQRTRVSSVVTPGEAEAAAPSCERCADARPGVYCAMGGVWPPTRARMRCSLARISWKDGLHIHRYIYMIVIVNNTQLS